MKKLLAALAVAAASLSLACGATPPPAPATPAAPSAAPAAAASSAGLKAPGEAKVGDKTTCLISKEEFTVTDASPKVEHEGKTYYFCCSGCDQKFKKDPQKYLGKGGST